MLSAAHQSIHASGRELTQHQEVPARHFAYLSHQFRSSTVVKCFVRSLVLAKVAVNHTWIQQGLLVCIFTIVGTSVTVYNHLLTTASSTTIDCVSSKKIVFTLLSSFSKI